MEGNLVKDISINETNKLQLKTKIGYAVGALGDGIMTNYIFMFFLFFMTDFAGINPSVAGLISLVAVLWDCITDPVVGSISDNSKNPKGRRIPIIAKGIIPWIIVTFFTFSIVDFPTTGKIIYYLVMGMAFWTTFTIVQTPYIALLPEVTSDPHERTSLRSYSVAIGALGQIILALVPFFLFTYFPGLGFSEPASWKIVTMLVAGISGIGYYSACLATRRYDMENSAQLLKNDKMKESKEKINIFKSFREVFKVKGFLIPSVAILLAIFAYLIIMTLVMYLMKYKLMLDEKSTSLVTGCYTFMQIIFIPFINYWTKKYGPKKTYTTSAIIVGIVIMSFKFIGLNSLPVVIAHALIVSFMWGLAFTVLFQFVYNASDLNYLKTGKKSDGLILAVFALIAKLGGALAGAVAGNMLTFIGYNPGAAQQTQQVLKGLVTMNTILPGLLVILSGVIVIFFPIKPCQSVAIRKAIELKEIGEEYSTEEFADLM